MKTGCLKANGTEKYMFIPCFKFKTEILCIRSVVQDKSGNM